MCFVKKMLQRIVVVMCVCTVCSKQVEKEKRELARQYGMVRNEVSGGEIAEELEKERRSFQLSMCEVSDSACRCSFTLLV